MAFFPKRVLPLDLNGLKPVFASGMAALSESYKNRFGIKLQKISAPNEIRDFNYGMDGKLPWAAIDAWRGSDKYVRVLQRANQVDTAPGFLTDLVSSFTNGPKVAELTVGTERCMWMESDCMIDNITPDGTPHLMHADNIAQAGVNQILQNAVTVMQVAQVHSSAYCNQVTGPFRGCMFSLSGFDGVSIVPHTRIFNECDNVADINQTAGGGVTVEDGVGFRFANPGDWVETTPFVLTYITGPDGTFVGRNEDFRSTTAHSAGTRVAVNLFIGGHSDSLAHAPKPPQDGQTEGMGFAESFTLVWDQALTMRQAAAYRNILYALSGINRLHSHSNKPLIFMCSDSIWAGYKARDLRGWDKTAMGFFPSDVRWANFAVPGAGFIRNPASPYFGSCAVNWFPGWMAQAVRQHRGRVCFLIGAAVNDFFDGTVTAAQVHKDGFLKMISLVRGIDPTAKIIAITGTNSSNSITDGHIAETAALLVADAGTFNYQVVDTRADPFMQNIALATEDGSHLSEMGCVQLAFLLRPAIQAWLNTLGPY